MSRGRRPAGRGFRQICDASSELFPRGHWFLCLVVAIARSLGSHAMLLAVKRAPVLNWRQTSGGGLGLLVARELRLVEDRGFPTVAALDLRDFAPAL